MPITLKWDHTDKKIGSKSHAIFTASNLAKEIGPVNLVYKDQVSEVTAESTAISIEAGFRPYNRVAEEGRLRPPTSTTPANHR